MTPDIHIHAPGRPAKHWLDRGWWEVRCQCGCGSVRSVPTLDEIRRNMHRFAPGKKYIIVRRTGMRRGYRERFRLAACLSKSGRLIAGIVRSSPLHRTQHKGG
jgi:hypothetical protein